MLELMFPLNSVHTQWTSVDCQQLVCNTSHAQQMSLLVCSNPELASSLLLQAAVTCNMCGGRVVFITTEPWHQLPTLVHGMPKPDPLLMHRIQMLYMNEADQLISYLADIHQPDNVLPDVLIVHGLDVYASCSASHDSRQHNMARLGALLTDTAAFIATNKGGASCSRLIASVNDADNAYTDVYSRFFKDFWIVRNLPAPGADADDVDDKYEMITSSKSVTSPTATTGVEFVATAEALVQLRVVQRHSQNALPVSAADGDQPSHS